MGSAEIDLAAMIDAILVTLQLAAVTTLILFLIGAPFAWWLSRTHSRAKPLLEALTALPLVLPPTVIGFYVLIVLNPEAPVGRLWLDLTGDTLTFSFAGLVTASILYSLPFMVQPLQSAFENIPPQTMEAAASLRASPVDAFLTVAVPLSARGFLTAGILTFAHTVGEFGVVLMVGGSIPGKTRTISIAIYEQVEALSYAEAHIMSAGLLIFSLAVLLFVYGFSRSYRVRVG